MLSERERERDFAWVLNINKSLNNARDKRKIEKPERMKKIKRGKKDTKLGGKGRAEKGAEC